MRIFGREPWPLKDFASSMKRLARQSLDSLIAVMSFHSGDRSDMPGELDPFILL